MARLNNSFDEKLDLVVLEVSNENGLLMELRKYNAGITKLTLTSVTVNASGKEYHKRICRLDLSQVQAIQGLNKSVIARIENSITLTPEQKTKLKSLESLKDLFTDKEYTDKVAFIMGRSNTEKAANAAVSIDLPAEYLAGVDSLKGMLKDGVITKAEFTRKEKALRKKFDLPLT